jgi:D-cysteine desulfhydrase
VPTADLALFRAFPGLRDALPRWPLLAGPTPVEPLALPGFVPGTLYVKRDERSAPGYGGNKPRKLEFLIGQALARGSRQLVTSGGLGTHHGLATAILGHSAGLRTSLILVHQPITAEVRESLQLAAAWGADLVYGRNVPGTAIQSLRVLTRSALRGDRPHLIWPGGSSARGNLGFVSAGLELGQQVKRDGVQRRIVQAQRANAVRRAVVDHC